MKRAIWLRRGVGMVAFGLVAVVSLASCLAVLEARHEDRMSLTPDRPWDTRRFSLRFHSPSVPDAGLGTIRLSWLATESSAVDAGLDDAGLLADGGAFIDDLQVTANFTNGTQEIPLLPGCSSNDCIQLFEVEFSMTGQRLRPVEVQYVVHAESTLDKGSGATLSLTNYP